MPNVAHTMHHTVQAVKLNTQMGLGPRTQTHHGDGLWDSFGLGKPPLLLETFPGASRRHQACALASAIHTRSLPALSLLAFEDCPAGARRAGDWMVGWTEMNGLMK